MFKSKQLYIDKEQQRYKRFFRFLGIPFNEGWKPLPQVKLVGVTRISVARTISSPFPAAAGNGGLFEDKDQRYFVFMIASKTKKIEIFRVEDLSKALEFAGDVAHYLQVPLVDYTKKGNP